MEEDIDLGINPEELNETESRLITLLFTLLKYPEGLNLQQIRRYMPEHYNNENEGSDQKKVSRDMDELNDLGFSAIFDKSPKVYKIKLDVSESKLKFSDEELNSISLALINQTKDGEYSPEVYSLAQKIFGSKWSLYPFFPSKGNKTKHTENNNQIIETILHSIKSKIALRITYERSYGLPEEKDLDPIQILRKNSTDLYLYAFDRIKKEARYYLIPCIKSIFKLDSPFIMDHIPKQVITTLNALQFQNHEPLEVSIKTTPKGKMEIINYLDQIPFTEEEDRILFSTTNVAAIFPTILRLKNNILEIQPLLVQEQFRNFLGEVIASHSQ